MAATRKDGLARREALLDAALRCFSRHGLLATGIEQIRKEAQASPSSVYHLFADLEALTVALLLRTFERLFGHLATRLGKTRSARAAVLALVDGHLEWVLSHREEARFMYQASSLELSAPASSKLMGEKAQLMAPVLRAFEPHLRKGSLPAWSPLLLDVVLLGPSHEACRRYLAGAQLDPAWLRAHLPALAWHSVRGQRAGSGAVTRTAAAPRAGARR